MLLHEIPHLRRYAYSLVRDAGAADDLVQDSLERALRKWRLWRAPGSLRSWLFRMLYRTYLNVRRVRRPEQDAVAIDGMVSPPAVAAPQEAQTECEQTVQALERLPDDHRAAILLVALEDMSYEEAAWALGIPIGTLRSRLSRAREMLRSLCDMPQAQPSLRRVK